MTSVETRRQAILELIDTQEVASQARLLELLTAGGVQTTQPQVSRDLRALHVAKRDGIYGSTERITPLDHLATLLRDARLAGPHMVCLFTEPGAASAIARALESSGLEGLVGTVAGDDTVFCAVDDASAGDSLSKHILGIIE